MTDSNNALSTSVFMSFTIFSIFMSEKLCKPALYLAIKIFLTDFSSLFSEILPFFKAFFISLVLTSKSSGIRRISLPAKNARTSAESSL